MLTVEMLTTALASALRSLTRNRHRWRFRSIKASLRQAALQTTHQFRRFADGSFDGWRFRGAGGRDRRAQVVIRPCKNPSQPRLTKYCTNGLLRFRRALSSVGRAPRLHRGCRGFESLSAHHFFRRTSPERPFRNRPVRAVFLFYQCLRKMMIRRAAAKRGESGRRSDALTICKLLKRRMISGFD